LIRVALFLLFLFVIGEILKRIRRAKVINSSNLINVRESVLLSPNATFSAVELGSHLYLVVSGPGGSSLIDKLPVTQVLAPDLKQRRINGLK
jgi:flagellar biogenesis protein FliO